MLWTDNGLFYKSYINGILAWLANHVNVQVMSASDYFYYITVFFFFTKNEGLCGF